MALLVSFVVPLVLCYINIAFLVFSVKHLEFLEMAAEFLYYIFSFPLFFFKSNNVLVSLKEVEWLTAEIRPLSLICL